MARIRAGAGGAQEIQGLGQSLVAALASGEALPGQFEGLFGGITEDVAADIAQRAVEQQAPSEAFQLAGALDTGARQSIQARIRGETLTRVAETNLERRLRLLGLGIGGAQGAEAQQLAQETVTGERLAGLRQVRGTGRTDATQISRFTGPNPFLEAFQRSLGESFGPAISGKVFPA